ncbi:MAG: hypothetical protein QOJ06_3140 [Pseudonocardiales bacterium]|nr:hypothetical protein [Pseudonocardiales bacterium]
MGVEQLRLRDLSSKPVVEPYNSALYNPPLLAVDLGPQRCSWCQSEPAEGLSVLAPKEQEDLLVQLVGLAVDVQRWARSVEHRISAVAEMIEQSSAQASSAGRPSPERPARRTRAGPRSVA